jgi:hypothetical protein
MSVSPGSSALWFAPAGAGRPSCRGDRSILDRKLREKPVPLGCSARLPGILPQCVCQSLNLPSSGIGVRCGLELSIHSVDLSCLGDSRSALRGDTPLYRRRSEREVRGQKAGMFTRLEFRRRVPSLGPLRPIARGVMPRCLPSRPQSKRCSP